MMLCSAQYLYDLLSTIDRFRIGDIVHFEQFMGDLDFVANVDNDGYIYLLTQEEIATIAGFIQPTSSDIDTDAISGPFDTLREKFPERAFWETVDDLGESFYWNAEEDDR